MTWKYGLVKHKEVFKVAEIYDDGCYAILDTNDWYFETHNEAIKVLRTILLDVEGK